MTPAPAPVLEPPVLDVVPDLALLALDMDGSLLDDDKRIHPTFWPLLDELLRRGVAVVPASGRQYATLRRELGRDDLVYVAENGSYVVRDGQALAVDGLATATAHAAVQRVRDAADLDVGTVLCGIGSAYVERTDEAFLAQCAPYYARLEVVDDLLAVDDTVLKVAVYDFGGAEAGAATRLADLGDAARVLVSGEHWVDVMSPTADKGTALRAVQAALGVGPGADDGVRRLPQRRRHARCGALVVRDGQRAPAGPGAGRGTSPRPTRRTAWSAPSRRRCGSTWTRWSAPR